MSEVAQKTGLSFPTVSKCINHLCQLNILEALNARKRNKVFFYKRYIDILNEESDY